MTKTPRTTRRVGPTAAKRAAALRAHNAMEEARAATIAEQPVWPPPEPVAEIADPVVARQEFDDPIEGPIEVPEGELARLAHEINSRLTIADTYLQKTNDHQLAVALQLARVKAICTERKINFRTWSETNLPPDRSWQMIRKLARVGEADNPQLALEEWRGAAAKRSAAYHQRLKSGAQGAIEGPRENVVAFTPPPPAEEPPVLAPMSAVVHRDQETSAAEANRGEQPNRYDVLDTVSQALAALTEPQDQEFVIVATLQNAGKDTAKAAIEKVFGVGSLAA